MRAVILIFASVTILWFGVSLAYLVLGIATGLATTSAHAIYGYGVATVQVAILVGWIWALYSSTRARSLLNGPVQAMCAATAAAQIAIVIATVAVIGGWIPGGRGSAYLGHAAVAAILAIAVWRGRSSRNGCSSSEETAGLPFR